MNKFLIIDGNSLVNRAFYALPLLSNSQGEYSNAVYGFVNILTKAIQEQKPKYIAVAFDYGKKTFRHQIYAEYKGTRKGMPNELASQMPILKDLLSAMNIKYFEKENIEADDIIGTLSMEKSVEKLLLSGDKDLFQLIDDKTFAWFPKKGVSDIKLIKLDDLKVETGLTPQQIVEYKSLRGDASDNIPGVPGIGEKGALNLLQEYGSLDGIYENINNLSTKIKEKLEQGKELAYISKQLATIKRDVNLKWNIRDCEYTFPYNKKTFEFFKKYEFKSLIRRTDIFDENVADLVNKESQPFEIVKVNSAEKMEQVINFIKEEKRLAFDLSNNLKIACSANIVYSFEEEISMFSSELSIDKALSLLRPVFEDEKIEKICFDAKKQKHLLNNFNIEILGNVFDINLAKYLIGENIKDVSDEPVYFFNAKKTLEVKMKELGVEDLYNKIELPLVEVLYSMENYGLLVDEEQLRILKEDLEEKLEKITNEILELAGENFNLNSPKQLSNILFNKLGLKANNNSKLSTSADVLQEIESQHKIVSLILKYRKIQKLLTTYVEEFFKIASKNNGYIRTIFNQTQTATGRLSSSDPNLQNLPIKDEEGRQLRKVFISRFSGGEIISADYNQIELRLMAHYSQDETLVGAYKRGEDIHARTASSIFGVAISDVTPAQRRLAKTVNFGIIYGISEYGLSLSLNTSVKRAGEYMKKYFEIFPRVKEYIGESIELAKEKGYATTLFGRIRFIPELKADNAGIRKFGERVAINMPLQGTASDIIKIAMINVFNKLKKEKLEAKLVLQIHDELIIDAPHNEIKKVSAMLSEEMENVVNLSIKLPVEVSSGKTLYECK